MTSFPIVECKTTDSKMVRRNRRDETKRHNQFIPQYKTTLF